MGRARVCLPGAGQGRPPDSRISDRRGHWAELAGGSQVTAQLITERAYELRALLEQGASVPLRSAMTRLA
ncbi:hypothetical protein ACQEVO_30700 [Nocardia sp. CA-290969]